VKDKSWVCRRGVFASYICFSNAVVCNIDVLFSFKYHCFERRRSSYLHIYVEYIANEGGFSDSSLEVYFSPFTEIKRENFRHFLLKGFEIWTSSNLREAKTSLGDTYCGHKARVSSTLDGRLGELVVMVAAVVVVVEDEES